MTATEEWLKSLGKVTGAQTALGLSVDDRKPDDLAEQMRLGQQLGLPPVVVASDPDGYRARAAQKAAADLLADAPITAKWLQDRTNGGLAKDDVENLSWFEKNVIRSEGALTRAAGRGVVRTGAMVPALEAEITGSFVGDMGKTVEQIYAEEMAKFGNTQNPIIQADARRKAQMRFDALDGMTAKNKADALAGGADALQRARAALDRSAAIPKSEGGQRFQTEVLDKAENSLMGVLKAFASDPVGGAAFIAETAAETLPLLLASTGVTLATRNPAAGISIMAGGSFLLENSSGAMDFLAEKGVDLSTPEAALAVLENPELMAEATQRGLSRGLVIALFDAVSGGVAGQTLMKSAGGEVVVQGIAQMAFGAGGEAAAQVVAGQDLSWKDIVVEGLAELATAPIEVGGVAGRGLIKRFGEFTKSGATAERLAAIDEKATASKLRERDPARFKDLLDQVSGDQFLYVPAEDLQTYFQAKDTGFDPADWGIDPNDYAEQLATGGNVAIPVSAYAAKASGTPDADWFRDNAVFSLDEMSVAEAARFNEEVRGVMDEAMAEADRARVTDLETRASDVQVYDGLYGQLRAAGRGVDVAMNEARAMTAFFRSMAARYGEDALDLARRFGLAIEGAAQQPNRRRGQLDIALNTLRRGMPKSDAQSLTDFVVARGGVRDMGGDLEAMGVPKGVIAETRAQYLERGQQPSLMGIPDGAKGDTLDNIARAAVAAGYFPALAGQDVEGDITGAVMEALREEVAGRKTYAVGDAVDTTLTDLADELSRRGLDIAALSNDEIVAALNVPMDGDTYGQDGRLVTDSAAFREWFGDSAVVDADGKPLVVYHHGSFDENADVPNGPMHFGTEGAARERAFGKAKDDAAMAVVAYENDDGIWHWDSGSGLTSEDMGLAGFSDAETATAYGRSQVMRDLEDGGLDFEISDLGATTAVYLRIENPKRVADVGGANGEWDAVIAQAIAEGHDGVVYRNLFEDKGSDSYVAFSSTQIKSVFNRGTFDANDPRILYQVTPEQARKIDMDAALPDDPLFVEAVQNTAGAEITADGLLIDLVRYQKPEQVGATSVRTGVFYLPTGSKNAKFYKGKGSLNGAYGGAVEARGKTLVKRPLFVKGGTGGKAPEAAYEAIKGKGAMKALDKAVMSAITSRSALGRNPGLFEENIYNFLEEYGADGNLAYEIIENSKQGNQLRYALQENVIAHVVREAGYDSVIGYTKGKAGAGIAEVFDVREIDYPVPGEQAVLHPMFDGGTFLQATPEMFSDYLAAKAEASRLRDELKNPEKTDAQIKAAFDKMIAVGPERAKLAEVLAAEDGGLELKAKDGQNAAISKSQDGKGGWRVTYFGPDGFFGHTEYTTKVQAINDALQSGYDELDTGALRRAMKSRTFFQTKRGSITFPTGGLDGRQSLIKLFENADLSTVWHEFGHYSLEVFTALAMDAKAPQGMKDDLATIQKYLKASGTKYSTEQHETWARSFEAYAMEGKAPSLELADAFARMKAWLTRIYQTVRGLNVKLTPEVREVMDRLLATDAEIETMRSAQGMKPLFTDEAAAGMSPEAFKTYQRIAQRSVEQAQASLLEKTMAKVRREKEAWWKAEYKTVLAEVTATINSQRPFRLVEMLANKQWLGDTARDVPDIQINRDELVEAFGEGVLAELSRSRLGGKRAIYAKDGASMMEVADLFGFANPQEMVDVLQNAGKRKDAIRNEASRIMTDRYGDPFTDGTIEQEALDAIHSEQQAKTVAAEVRHLAKRANLPTRNLTSQVFRQRARMMIGRMTVGEATKPNAFLGAERRAAKRAEDAFARVARGGGQDALVAATRHKEQQLLNHYLYLESRDLTKMVESGREKMRAYDKASVRKKLEGGYIEQIDALLDDYDFRVRGKKQINRAESLAAFVQRMTDEGRAGELSIDPRLIEQAQRKHYSRLSVDELLGLFDTIDNIDHLGRFKQKLIDEQEARDQDAVVAGILGEFASNVPLNPPSRTRDASEESAKTFRDYLNTTLNADTLLREIDGFKDLGPMWMALKSKVDAGMNRLTIRRREMTEAFDAIYAVYSIDEKADMATKRRNAALGIMVSKWELIALALNTGNADNFERLTNPKAPGHFQPGAIEAALAELDARDWQVVQRTWDYVNSFWPEIEAKEKRQTGVTPKKVEAKLMVSAPAGVTGGYYPIKYDARLSGLTADFQQKELAQALMGGAFSKAQTRNGHVEARKSTSRQPVQLDLSVAHSHVEQVIYDLEIGEAIAASYRLLQDNRVRSAFINSGKQSDFDALEIWMQDVAAGDRASVGGIQSYMRHVRSGFTISRLALNLSTALIQPSGLAQSAVVVGKGAIVKGAISYLRNPSKWSADVLSVSPMMRERQVTFERDIFNAVGDLALSSDGTSWVSKKLGEVSPVLAKKSIKASIYWQRLQRDIILPLSFVLMQKVQFYAVDMPTWVGAYEKEIGLSGNEAKARLYADSMVKRAQGSGLMSDRGMLERGSLNRNSRQQEFPKMLTALGSYMFAKGNVAYERIGKTNFKDPVAVFSLAADMALLFTFEAILYSAVKGGLPDDDEDEPQDWAAWLASQTAFSALSTLPLLREVSGAAQGFSGGGIFGSSIETLVRPFTQAKQGEFDKPLVKAFVDAGGVLLHLPSSQTKAVIDGIFDADMSVKDELSPGRMMGLGGGKGRSLADILFGE